MPFSGVHVACGYVGDTGGKLAVQSLLRAPHWSQTFPSGASGVTTMAAPGRDGEFGAPAFEVRATIDVWVAIGSNPDASLTQSTSFGNSRVFIPANETRNIFSRPNDKLAWLAA